MGAVAHLPDRSTNRHVVLAAPDSFKGSATAAAVADAVASAAAAAGGDCDCCPMSDGGEGFADVLAVLGGDVRHTDVHGPLGLIVRAPWRLAGDDAVIESAAASGLVLVGGAGGNDPVAASTRGTGELVAAAVASGARHILVGVGGSATTDGGLGAVDAIEASGGLRGATVVVACDVDTRFVDAAAVFGPQKGADQRQVRELEDRLHRLVDDYRRRFGVDVGDLRGAGAAGGLAGGLAALGAELRSGFDLVADAVGLRRRLEGCDLVVTGEGRLDAPSWSGKVVGGVCRLAAERSVPVLIVAGSVAVGPPGTEVGVGAPGTEVAEGSPRAAVTVVDLSERFGLSRSLAEPAACVSAAVTHYLSMDGD